MRILTAMAMACLATAARPAPAASCSKRHQTVFELADLARDVAVVRVTSAPGPGGAGPVALRVQQRIKGPARRSIAARETNTSCATGFRRGRTALVFVGADRWPVGHHEGYIERPRPAHVAAMIAWVRAATDGEKAAVLVPLIAGADEALRDDAAWFLLDHPALIAALDAAATEELGRVAATLGAGTRREIIAAGLVVAILARQHGAAWRDLLAKGGLPARAPGVAALAAHNFEDVPDPAALAEIIDKATGESAPERIAAFERCERIHGHLLEEYSTYSHGRAERWWPKLAEACRTGARPHW
jgi:hypothetical protein